MYWRGCDWTGIPCSSNSELRSTTLAIYDTRDERTSKPRVSS